MALHSYHSVRKALPPGVYHPRLLPGVSRLYGPDNDPYPLMNWHGRILPYIEQNELWKEIDRAYKKDPYYIANPPHTSKGVVIPLFLCPADTERAQPLGRRPELRAATTSYLGVEGRHHLRQDGLLFVDSRIALPSVRNGLSYTLLVGERPASADGEYGRWYGGWGRWGTANSTLGVREDAIYNWVEGCPVGPYKFQRGSLANPCSVFHFWSLHSGGGNFLFADGSVHFLSYSVEPILPALASRNGSEPVAISDL